LKILRCLCVVNHFINWNDITTLSVYFDTPVAYRTFMCDAILLVSLIVIGEWTVASDSLK
jgi:hypothetical protein